MKFDPADYSVGIGFPCGSGMIPWQTTMSLVKTINMLARLGIPVNVYLIAGSSIVEIARDVTLGKYLGGNERFLFWVDADIVWEAGDFLRMLRLTKELGIVCAAYPLKREPPDIILNFVEKEPTLNQLGCVEVYGTGLGFTCIKREIVEQFAKSKEKMYHCGSDTEILDAFRLDTTPGDEGRRNSRGEDMAFFHDLRELGHRIWLEPTISLGHVGMKEYRFPLDESVMVKPVK